MSKEEIENSQKVNEKDIIINQPKEQITLKIK